MPNATRESGTAMASAPPADWPPPGAVAGAERDGHAVAGAPVHQASDRLRAGLLHASARFTVRYGTRLRFAGQDLPRFGNPMDFEMYNMGHLISAACVHFAATGKTNLLDAARKHKKVVQVVTQRRSTPHLIDAREKVIKAGLLGKVALVENYCYYHMRNNSNPPDSTPPENLDWEMWTGPAPMRPFNRIAHPRGWRAFMKA